VLFSILCDKPVVFGRNILFFCQHFSTFEHYTDRRTKTDSELMQSVNEINPDFAAKAGQAAGEQSSKSNLNIFLAELGRLKRIVAGFGLSVPDGEDVLQDVSIQALKQSGKYQSRGDSVRWLIKVTVNRCLMEHRRRRSFHRHTREILRRRVQNDVGSIRADEKVIVAEELEIVRESLQKLDNSLLGPMVLRYFCDLNSKEVGQILGLNPSTVRSRLREARMILAERLSERGVEP
jgi:RNA polymerase sigma-70 factor (ECF subfamily)